MMKKISIYIICLCAFGLLITGIINIYKSYTQSESTNVKIKELKVLFGSIRSDQILTYNAEDTDLKRQITLKSADDKKVSINEIIDRLKHNSILVYRYDSKACNSCVVNITETLRSFIKQNPNMKICIWSDYPKNSDMLKDINIFGTSNVYDLEQTNI